MATSNHSALSAAASHGARVARTWRKLSAIRMAARSCSSPVVRVTSHDLTVPWPYDLSREIARVLSVHNCLVCQQSVVECSVQLEGACYAAFVEACELMLRILLCP